MQSMKQLDDEQAYFLTIVNTYTIACNLSRHLDVDKKVAIETTLVWMKMYLDTIMLSEAKKAIIARQAMTIVRQLAMDEWKDVMEIQRELVDSA